MPDQRIGKPRSQRTLQMEFDPVPESIMDAGEAIRCIARAVGFTIPVANRLARAVSEMVLNACSYAYPPRTGRIVVRAACGACGLQIDVIDFGRGFHTEDYLRADGTRGPLGRPNAGLDLAAAAVDRISVRSGSTGTTVRMIKRFSA